MKCPLLKIARAGLLSEAARPLDDCLREDCAWWDEVMKKCSVQVLAQFSVGASVYLHNISENMPFKAQL